MHYEIESFPSCILTHKKPSITAHCLKAAHSSAWLNRTAKGASAITQPGGNMVARFFRQTAVYFIRATATGACAASWETFSAVSLA
jgi:hypothetical protein